MAARAEVGLGQLALQRGEIDAGISLLEQALAAAGHLPAADASEAGKALGRVYAAQGRFEEAFALLERLLDDARDRGDEFDALRFGLLLANAHVDAGNYGQAQELLGKGLKQAQSVVDPRLRASVYWSQSRLHSSQGRADLAADYAQLTIATLKATEHTLEASRTLLLLASVENNRGNPEAALELVDEGQPVVAAIGESAEEGMFAIERARALDALGEPEQAVSLLLGALSKLTGASPVSAARAYAEAAKFFRARGDLARALELYELAWLRSRGGTGVFAHVS